MTTSLSNITVKDGQNTLVVKANDITINGSSILTTNNFVTLDTDQSITGAKTFLFDTFRRATNIERGVAPSTVQYASYMIRDKDDKQIANFYVAQEANNTMVTSMIATNLNSSNNAFDAGISVAANRDGTVYTSAPTPATSDNSTQIATTAWVNNQKYVTLNTDQSITGTKTFTSTLYLIKDTPQITLKSTSMDITQSGWATGRNTIAWCQDKNGNESGGVFNAIETDSNKIFTDMYAMSRKTGSQVAAHLRIGIDENGNPYATAPTPATSDNSNKIATTNWVNNQKYVTLNTNQTITGTKTFTNAVIKQLSTNNSSGQYQDTYKVVDTNLDTTTNPEYIKQYYHAVKDKNNNYLAFIASTYNTDGSSNISLNARTRNTDNSGNVQGMIEILVRRDGTIITKAPTPAIYDNSTQIATTAYCNKKHQVVSALPASPDANVFYYIPA